MKTRQAAWLQIAVLALTLTFVTASRAPAQGNPYYEACKTLGGVYEERRTGCDPECEITYICRFAEGLGRMCDEQGVCGPYSESSAGQPAEQRAVGQDAGGSEAGNGSQSDEPETYQECAEASRQECEDECSGRSRREGLECLRSCLDDRCGEYERDSDEGTSDTTGSESASSSSQCNECMSACQQDCAQARRPRQRQACQAGCESKCAEECN